MKIVFNINYRTQEGQTLYVSGSIPALGEWQWEQAAAMTYDRDGNWNLAIETSAQEIAYQYIVIGNGEIIREPWTRKHTVRLDFTHPVCYLFDCWQLVPADVSLYTAAFTKNLFVRHNSVPCSDSFVHQLVIRVLCPRVARHQSLFISGNQTLLGDWNPELALEMHYVNFPEWEVRLNIDEITLPLEYKFLIGDRTKSSCDWETGENRCLSTLPTHDNAVCVINDYPYRDSRPAWKGAGTVIPVFSLRSEQSFGIGDMFDLKLLIDWAKQTNQCVIQLLPLNDTTATYDWPDSYPYRAISIYALHPVYISLSDLGELKDAKLASAYNTKQKRLNKTDTICYERVIKAKMRYCRLYFEQEKEQIQHNEDFQLFCRDNSSWLEPYAVFCYYRDTYKTADFRLWPQKNAVYRPSMAQDLKMKSNKFRQEFSFTCFLQFVLHTRFNAVSDYAREMGVILKGDLPIGISRNSVEAWMEASYFNCDMQAGAPPDLFSANGQNWSFPTYNREVMEQDGYAWWKKRFRKISEYVDCLRIDHILGFFRIWEIPYDYVQGLCGHFKPAIPLSTDEIEKYGFVFDKRYLKPQIHPRYLVELFGNEATRVAKNYLESDSDGLMGLQPWCDTQRKIVNLCDQSIRDGLLQIANEVLFVEDPYEKNKYHPRIQASQSYIFQSLHATEQKAFQQLSDDFFYERHTDFWKKEALKRLTPLVDCTEMLICGEDLGMIPKPVHEVMEQLHILTLELERTPKAAGTDFTDLQRVPYLSVCTTSTHDMEPLRSWWETNRLTTQHYYESVLQGVGEAPQRCTADIAKQILINHLQATSMLAIIPLQDWLAMSDLKSGVPAAERINIPANPDHRWDYRMYGSLEQLLQANELNRQIREMIETSGR